MGSREWAGFGIAVVSFLMGILSLLHIWGKPKISITFDFGEGYRLTCWTRNMPVPKILAWLNVGRRQVRISPEMSITDSKGTLVHFQPYAPTTSDDLRPVIASIKSVQDGKVYLMDVDNKPIYETLPIGEYHLAVEVRGEDVISKRREGRFRVNAGRPFVEEISS